MNIKYLKGFIVAINDTKYNKVSLNSRMCCMTRIIYNNTHCMNCMNCIYFGLAKFICKRSSTEKFQRMCK